VKALETKNTLETMEELRDRSVNMILKVLAVIIPIPLAGSLYRITSIGWQPVMFIHLIAAGSIYFVYGFRKRLAVAFRSWFLIILFLILGLGGLANFGVLSEGNILMLLAVVFTTSLLGTRYGLVVFGIGMFGIVTASVIYLNGFKTYNFNPVAFATSLPAWINILTAFVLSTSIIIAVFGIMNASFIQSIETLQRRRRELEEEINERVKTQEALIVSENNYHEIFDATTDAIFVLDMETGSTINVNQGMLEMFGYTLDEAKNMSAADLGAGTPPYSEQEAIEWMKKSIEEGPQRFEWLAKKKNDELFWVEVNLKCTNIGEADRILASVRDISKFKTSESNLRRSLYEKEVLLSEIHHRVKSNLQSITGLLNLQAAYDSNEVVQKALKDSRLRIRTMALIHETLYQSKDMNSVDMREFVSRLVSNLAISYGADPDRITLKVEVDDVSINMDTAIPAGLIINELVSNALIHAFPAQGKGQVRTSFHTVGKDVFRLAVSDTGSGLPQGFDIQRSESLGMQLVTALGEQLGTGIEVTSDRGARFQMEFKEYFEAGTELY
jgi:PAS domain S-box-containing protein